MPAPARLARRGRRPIAFAMTLRLLDGLSEIAGAYDALYCDAWGVIHDGTALYDGVSEALHRFRTERGPVIVLTNAPRLSDVIPAQLARLGLPDDAYDAVVTSGDATRAEVERRKDARFYRLGPQKDDGLFDAIETEFVALRDADAILCTGLLDDLHETPEDYRPMLTDAAARGLPMICANPDKVVRYGDRLMYCAGALGDLYETLGGEVVMAGKPHAPIYRLAREAAVRAGAPEDHRALVVGDSVRTDITGANAQDLDAIFVAQGVNLTEARSADGRVSAERIEGLLAEGGAHAAFAADGLRW